MKASIDFTEYAALCIRMKVSIDFTEYAALCIRRCREYWQGQREEALDLVLDALENCGGDVPGVMDLVDNLVVNAEIVDAEEFCEGGKAEKYYFKYAGDWDVFVQDCYCGNNSLAVVSFQPNRGI